jgi:hypothetical protein
MYAILTNKPKMARLFLKEGKNEIIGSLIASKIFQSYSNIYEEDSIYFKELAEYLLLISLNKIYKI